MKKRFLSVLLVLFLALSVIGAASLVSSPAATVNLIRNKAITNDEVDAMLKQYQNAGVSADRSQILNILINDEVFLQGAERDGALATDQEVESYVSQLKSQLESQVGAKISDADFESYIASNTGMTLAEYKEGIKESLTVQKYVLQEKSAELQNINTMPTDSQVEDFYRKNMQGFFQAENVKLAHVVKLKTDDEKKNEENAVLMTEVAEKIKNGSLTFEQAVSDYTDDAESKALGGDIGWLSIDNQSAIAGFGQDFVDAVMNLKTGEISGMLESNVGYHIVKVSVHNSGRILGIDDKINPESSETVRDYIVYLLANQNAQNVLANATNELIAELRSQARIRIY